MKIKNPAPPRIINSKAPWLWTALTSNMRVELGCQEVTNLHQEILSECAHQKSPWGIPWRATNGTPDARAVVSGVESAEGPHPYSTRGCPCSPTPSSCKLSLQHRNAEAITIFLTHTPRSFPPSQLDVTLFRMALRRGGVLSSERSWTDPGGKTLIKKTSINLVCLGQI